jgi:hypothetical protein
MNGSQKFNNPGKQFKNSLSEAKRLLRETIERHSVGVDGLHPTRFQLLKLFTTIERMYERIDAAFPGQAFLPNLAPDAPANTKRFNAYFARHKKATKLLIRALDLWLLTCGMKVQDDWVPLLIEEMRQHQGAQAVKRIANLRDKAAGSLHQAKTIRFPGV